MNIFVICILLFSFCSFLFGLIVVLKRNDLKGRLWFLFNLCCGIWGLGYAYQINNDVPYSTALFMTRIGDAFAIFIPITWFHFTAEFLEIKIWKKFLWALYGISIALFLTSPTKLFVPGLKDKSTIGAVHFADGGMSFRLFGLLFTSVVSLGFFLIVKEFLSRDLSLEKKRQIKFLLISSALGFGGGSIAFLPVYDIDVPVLYGTLIAPFFPILMTIAFALHHLLDIESIAQAAQQNKLETLGILSASINHELKNPIYIMRTLSDAFLIRMKERAFHEDHSAGLQKAAETCQKTIAQADRAMDIIRRLTSFARQEEAQMTSVELPKILENVSLFLSYEIMANSIRLTTDIPKDLPAFHAEPRYVEQIFFNLILNACQALKKGKKSEGIITLSACLKDSMVEITVADNGPGISLDVISRIFEPFYTTRKDGLGLGLYVIKQLVEKCGGSIRADSEMGKGTSFVLKFKTC